MGQYEKPARSFYGSSNRYYYKSHRVQSKPYKPMAYYALTYWARNSDGSSPKVAGGAASADLVNTANSGVVASWNKSYAKAFDKFAGKARSDFQTNLGETLGEMSSTSVILAERMGSMARAVGSFRRFDVVGGLRELGLKKPRRSKYYTLVRKGKTVARVPRTRVAYDERMLKGGVKTAGAVWLEYYLCWSPLLGDIYNTMQRAHEIHPLQFNPAISETGAFEANSHNRTTYSYWRGGDTTSGFLADRLYRTTISAQVRIKNPLKRKFVDSGVVNPVLIAWNLVPLSMFVDYWLPVSAWLDGYTTFYGLDIKNVQIGRRGVVRHEYYQTYTEFPHLDARSREESDFFERSVGGEDFSLPVPGLFDRVGKGLNSWTRALTLSSVLAQSFRA